MSTGLLQHALDFNPPRARRTDPKTSHAAAEQARTHIRGQCQQILIQLRSCPPGGMNGAEVDQILGWLNGTAVRHMKTLSTNGFIEHVGERATPTTGCMARTYRITAKGSEALHG